MKKIRNWLVSILVAMSVFCTVPAYSQTTFLMGLGFGALLFGDGDQAGMSAGIVYMLADVSKRVKNPLELRMVSIYGDFSERQVGQLNLLELFARAVKDYQKYEILQVVRVFRGDAPYRAAIWFSYIEKEKVLPLTAQK